ncbi:MAG: DUF4249 domain-containing protein [Bacteroidota bacterium]
MKKRLHTIFHVKAITCLLLCCVAGCREKYVPTLINNSATGYLVVDGFINSGTGPTTISLSRSTRISAAAAIVRETKATVRVVGKVNTTGFLLTETGTNTGIYSNPQLTLDPTDQYRLYIKTVLGKEYYSDYCAVRRTPNIDSVSWKVERDGVQIYANAHGNNAEVGYYQLKKEETWEFNSAYTSQFKTIPNPNPNAPVPYILVYRLPGKNDDLSIFTCWKTEAPTNILLYSTEKLTQNILSYQLAFIERGSWKLSIRYSIQCTFMSLSRANYQFLEQLRKNTEQLGTIFDAQPSENVGNIHNTVDANERVIGFVEISEEKKQRIFITRAQVPFWTYSQGCGLEYKVDKDSLTADGVPTHVAEYDNNNNPKSVLVAQPVCVDCTLRGSNTKPSFW